MRAPFPLLAASLLLTACADLAGRDRLIAEPAVPVVATPAVPLPERKPTPPPRRQPAKPPASSAAEAGAGAADAEVPAVVERGEQGTRPPGRHPIPEALTGLSADELRAIMGPPAQEIAEAPGVRWRYPGKGCTLDVHLFPRVESQGLFALDVSAEGLPASRCLDTFRAPPTEAAPQLQSNGTPQPLMPGRAAEADASVR